MSRFEFNNVRLGQTVTDRLFCTRCGSSELFVDQERPHRPGGKHSINVFARCPHCGPKQTERIKLGPRN